ncbi:thiazole biosynthesis protein thiH [Vibrio ishigakensis]|uniref:2-iminoacetate synthase n=1 Tax=Vibrio ishigakensis TaxID=1481914 RepID=A0A0B8PTJ9_9VIBR|nr:thiazole biosynthesis protein thiH [Vibrio ishigakensis]
MSFTQVFEQLDWSSISLDIMSKTEMDVRRALTKTKLDLEDFKALISPAAEPYLEQMAQLSHQRTRQRFGSNIGMYVPLYLSNLCANECTYCGFSMQNRIKRKTLNATEIDLEIDALKKMEFDSVLLVTGEHQNKVGMDYFRQAVPQIKEHFNYLALEVQPLDEDEYAELKTLGMDAVMVYQETYNPITYAEHHLRGSKKDFFYRLETPDRLAKAGVDKIGIGALIGLDNWRVDSFFVAAHLDYLERTYWRTRYSISLPRLRPCEGGVQPKSVLNDKQMVQLICAYRIFNQHVDLSLSTRESATFRDNIMPLGVTTVSAASKTQPGGYAVDQEQLEQFEISDERSASDVANAIKQRGLEPVWRDWTAIYSG